MMLSITRIDMIPKKLLVTVTLLVQVENFDHVQEAVQKLPLVTAVKMTTWGPCMFSGNLSSYYVPNVKSYI